MSRSLLTIGAASVGLAVAGSKSAGAAARSMTLKVYSSTRRLPVVQQRVACHCGRRPRQLTRRVYGLAHMQPPKAQIVNLGARPATSSDRESRFYLVQSRRAARASG